LGNTPALEFYKSSGFAEVGIDSGFMPGNEKYEVTVHVLCNAINAYKLLNKDKK
jgi:hypothetical protein